jgi:hypothetical protein
MFDLKIIFIKNFLKIEPNRVRFSPGFPPGAGLPGGACFLPIFRSSSGNENHTRAASLHLRGEIFRGFLGAPAIIRHTLEQIALREILLLEEIPGKSAHGLAPFFKSAL